jgi:hypothetical protein
MNYLLLAQSKEDEGAGSGITIFLSHERVAGDNFQLTPLFD